MLQVVPATRQHVEDIAARMRPSDIAEVRAASGLTPLRALELGLEKSDECYVAEFDGRAEVIFGVATKNLLTRVGVPWLLGTEIIETEYRHFLRGSVYWRDRFMSQYAVLHNFVDDRNVIAKRWIKWLGFTIHESVIIGFEQRPFCFFELRLADV